MHTECTYIHQEGQEVRKWFKITGQSSSGLCYNALLLCATTLTPYVVSPWCPPSSIHGTPPYTDTRELHIAERPLPSFSTRGHHLWLSTELGSLFQPSNILHRVHSFSHPKQCASECLVHCLSYSPTQLWSLYSHRIPILRASSLRCLV